MSVSLFFQAHLDGEDQQVPTSSIAKEFEPYITEKDEFGFNVKYDELNDSFVHINHSNQTCSSFSVNRPCLDDRLYLSIYQIMLLANFVCLTPDGECLAFSNDTKANLPDGQNN